MLSVARHRDLPPQNRDQDPSPFTRIDNFLENRVVRNLWKDRSEVVRLYKTQALPVFEKVVFLTWFYLTP
jgi:hypothetical protein